MTLRGVLLAVHRSSIITDLDFECLIALIHNFALFYSPRNLAKQRRQNSYLCTVKHKELSEVCYCLYITFVHALVVHNFVQLLSRNKQQAHFFLNS